MRFYSASPFTWQADYRASKTSTMKKKQISQAPPAKPKTYTGALHASVGFSGYSFHSRPKKFQT